MGQNQTKDQTTSPKANYTPEVEVLQEKFQNANYGEVKLVKDVATEQVMILKEIVVNTKQAFDAEVQFLNNRIEISQPNVAEIVGYNIKDQQNFCSTYYKISIYIENLEQTLQAQVEERIANSYTYTETELLQVADSLVSGLSYFQSQGFSHGDIRPTNIFVQGTTYKLSDPSLSAQKGQNGLSLAIIQGAKTYLAPELIAQVPKSDFEIKTDKYKADVFSLGLTLLSLATLSNVEELYNFEEGTINETLLADKLERIRYRYSPFTFDLIASMITISEEARPDFVALSNTLLPYQENIRSGASLYLYSQTETVKRSALPDDYSNTNYINSTNDDLEARIRAALERSEQTFRAVAARDHTFVHTHETQPNADLAKSYVAENTTPATEQVAPVQVTETITTTTYTTYTPVDVNATTTYTPVDVNATATYTPATTDYTTTYQYTPSTYNYTTTTYTPYTAPVEEKKPEGLLEKIEHAVEHAIGREEPHHHHHEHHEPAQINATADVTINS